MGDGSKDRTVIKPVSDKDYWLLWIILAIALFSGEPDIVDGLRHMATSGIQGCEAQPTPEDQ